MNADEEVELCSGMGGNDPVPVVARNAPLMPRLVRVPTPPAMLSGDELELVAVVPPPKNALPLAVGVPFIPGPAFPAVFPAYGLLVPNTLLGNFFSPCFTYFSVRKLSYSCFVNRAESGTLPLLPPRNRVAFFDLANFSSNRPCAKRSAEMWSSGGGKNGVVQLYYTKFPFPDPLLFVPLSKTLVRKILVNVGTAGRLHDEVLRFGFYILWKQQLPSRK